jgi:hypothetical protein
MNNDTRMTKYSSWPRLSPPMTHRANIVEKGPVLPDIGGIPAEVTNHDRMRKMPESGQCGVKGNGFLNTPMPDGPTVHAVVLV